MTLTGHVAHSYAEKVEAERAVRRVRGVRAIAQEIEVRYADDKKVADDQIAARALAIIDWSVHLPKQAIQVKVAGGWVTLTGTVDWQYQMASAEAAVRKLSGVHGVTNLVEVRPRVPPTAVKDKILEAFRRSVIVRGRRDQGTVSGDKVTLEGAVGVGGARRRRARGLVGAGRARRRGPHRRPELRRAAMSHANARARRLPSQRGKSREGGLPRHAAPGDADAGPVPGTSGRERRARLRVRRSAWAGRSPRRAALARSSRPFAACAASGPASPTGTAGWCIGRAAKAAPLG